MAQDFALNTLLARNSPSNEEDVLNVKGLLNRVGYYDEPSYGITPYPDGRLFQSIAKFQKDHDLTPDGWMRPGGETEQAMRLVARRGKPGLIDDDFGFPSAGDFALAGEVGKGHASREDDVLMAKRAMGALGKYPRRLLLDPTGIVDRELHEGLTQFQSENKLYSDGWMGPDGETAGAVRDALAAREGKHESDAAPAVNMPVPAGARISAGTDGGKGEDEKIDPNADPMWPSPEWSPEEIEAEYRRKADTGELFGLKMAPKFLKHYLGGSGEKITLDRDEAREIGPIKKAEETNRQRIAEHLVSNHDNFNEPLKRLNEGETVTINDDKFKVDFALENLLPRGEVDLVLASGSSTIKSSSNLKATMKDGVIHLEGTVTHTWEDRYDFDDGKYYAKDARILERQRGAKPFDLGATWVQRFEGTLSPSAIANGVPPRLRWKDVSE